jgi:hypothetical protein
MPVEVERVSYNPKLPEQSQPEIRYGDYRIKVSACTFNSREANPGFSKLEIFKAGRRVYAVKSHLFYVGQAITDPRHADSPFTVGKNVTGDGKPNLVVYAWNGGNWGFRHLLFELGPTFRLVQVLGGAEGDCFVNLDGGPALEFSEFDSTFLFCEGSCMADCVGTGVRLKYNGSRYVFAPELMRKPPLPPQALEAAAAEIRGMEAWAENNSPPVALWQKMIELVYSGNMAQAWALVDLAWQGDAAKKGKFLAAFKKKLKTSPYWPALADLNHVAK